MSKYPPSNHLRPFYTFTWSGSVLCSRVANTFSYYCRLHWDVALTFWMIPVVVASGCSLWLQNLTREPYTFSMGSWTHESINYIIICTELALCFSPSAPYVHGHATAVRGGEGGWQHYSDLHCLWKPQAGGHLAERGGSADQQQEIHGNCAVLHFSQCFWLVFQ